MNNIQTKKILEHIKGQEINLDEVQQHIMDIIVMSGLTNSEVAALLWSIMRNILAMEGNKEFMEQVGIDDINKLGYSGVFEIQKLLIHKYNKTLNTKQVANVGVDIAKKEDMHQMTKKRVKK